MGWDILVAPIASLLDKFIPDKDAREKMAHEIATMAENHSHEIQKLQTEVNKVEAAHKSLFVAGWRPFIGWVCGFGFASNFLVIPITNFWLALTNTIVVVDDKSELLQLPMVDLETMMPVLMGMLGLGVYRTYEKVKGVSREK
jgi:hypothetical protein